MTKTQYIIGFDLGGTKMMGVLLDRRFKILERSRKKSKSHKGEDQLFKRLVEVIHETLSEADLEPSDLAGIGIGVPGPVDPETGTIHKAPNLGLEKFPLGKKLKKEFDCPIVVDNDVNLGAYGEYHFGAGRGARHLIAVFPGTGIGGGLILDGKIYRGASGGAGEIGHISLDPHGPLCGCGKRGCLEAYAGRNIIASQLAALAVRGQAPHLMKKYGTDIADIRSQAIGKSIEKGDKLVENIVRDAAQRIGIACANAVNLLSPDRIVLGGGLIDRMPKIFLEETEDALDCHALPSLRKMCKVKIAELGDDAVVLGAAKLLCEKMGNDPNNDDE